MTTPSSILVWEILMDRGAWQATVHRVTKSRTHLSKHAILLKKKKKVSSYINDTMFIECTFFVIWSFNLVLGFVIEQSGSINKSGCKTPSTMCHLFAKRGPGRELKTAESTYTPIAAPFLKGSLKAQIKRE